MVKIMFAVQSYDLFQKFPNISTKKIKEGEKKMSLIRFISHISLIRFIREGEIFN